MSDSNLLPICEFAPLPTIHHSPPQAKFAEDFYLALPPAGADFQPKEKADEKGKYCYESKA